MNTDNTNPMSLRHQLERVTIIRRSTDCNQLQAIATLENLNTYDASITAGNATDDTASDSTTDKDGKPKTKRTRRTQRAKQSITFPDVYVPAERALVDNGYSQNEAQTILQTVFSAVSIAHGGKRLYVSKAVNFASIPTSNAA